MSTVATLLVRVAGDTKDAEKAFAGLEGAGKSLERTFSGLGTRLSGVGGDLAKGLGSSLSGIESAAGKAFGAMDQGLGKVGQALAPIANVLPGLPGGVQALAGAFGGFAPVPGILGGVGLALGAIGGIAVGVVGGLIALGKSAADAGDELLVLSQQSGISVENLSRFQYVSQQTDASVDKIVGSINKLGINLASGSKEANKAIESIGLSLADVKKLKPEDAFVAIVDGLGKIPGAGERARAGAAIFGKGWHDVSQLAAEDLRGLMAEADKFGATMSTELAVAGDRFNDTLGQLSTVFEGFKRAAGAGVLPVLTAFAEVLRDQVIVWLQKTGTTTATVQATFEGFALKVSLAMLQATASVARGMAEIATFFASRIIVDSPVYQGIEKFIRHVGVLDSIKPGEAFFSSLAAVPEKLRAIDQSLATDRWVDKVQQFQTATQATADRVATAADQMARDLPGALARIKGEITTTAQAMTTGQGAAIGYGTAMTAVNDKINDLVATLSGATAVRRAHELTEAFVVLTARGMKPTAAGAKMIVDALDDAAKATGTMSASAHKLKLALQEPLKVIPVLRQALVSLAPAIKAGTGLLASRELTFTPTFAIDTRGLTQTIVRDLRAIELAPVVAEWGKTLKTQFSGVLGGMFTGQTSFTDGFRSMLGALNGISAEIMTKLVKDIGTEFQKGAEGSLASVFGGKDAKKGAAVGAAVGLAAGMAFGSAFGKEVGALAGAASGAAAGAMVGSWVGAGVGAGVGFVTGWLAGLEKESQQRQALEASKSDLVAQFGSMTKLSKAAQQAGVDFDAMWNTQKPAEFNKWLAILQNGLTANRDAVEQINKGLDDTIRRGDLLSKVDLGGLASNTGRVGNRATLARGALPGSEEGAFAFLQAQQDAAIKGLDTFLSNATIKTEKGALAISASLAGLYDTLLEAGATPTQAFAQMEPVIAKLQAQLAASGMAASTAFGPLGALAGLAADAIAGPVMDAMAGLAQGLTSTANLGLLNQETFEGFAAEMLAGFKAMEAQGKGGEVALAGMQGSLQKLWELSTDFGYTLGPNEQAMLDFAVASGTVGDQFRPAADRMALAIDALVDRMDKFLQKFEEMPQVMSEAAKQGAQGVSNALADIKVPKITIPTEIEPPEGTGDWRYRYQTGSGGGATIPALASGGIVRRPTVALIGEKGPEAVVPLSKDFGASTDVTLMLDSEVLTRAVLRKQPRVMRAYGVAR